MRALPILLVSLFLISTTSAALAQQNQGLELYTYFTKVYLESGNSLSTTIYVKNDLSKPIDALLLADKPAGWTVEFRLMGYNVSDVFLTPGENKGVELRVIPPKNVVPGEYKIGIIAKTDNVVSNRLTLTMHIISKPTIPPLELTVPYLSLSGEPGSTLDYRFDVKNNLDEDVVVGLGVSAPRGWVAVFKPSTYENRIISSITLKPGEKKFGLVVSVKIPNDVKPGSYKINFTLNTEGYSETTNLIAKVIGIRKYSLSTSNQLLSFDVQAGEEKNITLLISNEGTESIDDIELSTVPPSGWNVKIEPKKIGVLGPGSTKTVTLSVYPPANTLAGDYSLRILASSQEAGEQRLDLRVTVTKQTYWGLIGVLVVAISIIALLLVFWRFGRP